MKEQKWIHEGLITESLPNGMFWVRLDNEDLILGYVSGRIRRSSIRILPGDRVKIEVSRYDSTRGHVRGRVVSWASAGTCGFKGTKRGTPFAAQTAVGNAIRTVVEQGMQRAEVMIKGPGLGRDAALRAIRRSGILLSFVRDVTPMPHNGCRPPKKRRV
ncbi:30S ribosomal protein S11 chloroplastic [Bienertia sinuspersici]